MENRLSQEVVKFLSSLESSYDILEWQAYAVYPAKCMFRIYMAFCEDGDLEDLIRYYEELLYSQARDQEGNLVQWSVQLMRT